MKCLGLELKGAKEISDVLQKYQEAVNPRIIIVSDQGRSAHSGLHIPTVLLGLFKK